MASQRIKDFLASNPSAEYYLVIPNQLLKGIIRGGRIPYIIIHPQDTDDRPRDTRPDRQGASAEV